MAALDVNEQLLLPGKQGCSSQALKFAMNGSILLGSRDSTNLRISNTLGQNVAVLLVKITMNSSRNNIKKVNKYKF